MKTHPIPAASVWMLAVLCGVLMLLAAPTRVMAEEEKTEENKAAAAMSDADMAKLQGEFDKLAKALTGDDCATITTQLKAFDTKPLQELMPKAQEAYPKGPPETMKASFEGLMGAVKGTMGKCASDEAFMAEFERVGKAMGE